MYTLRLQFPDPSNENSNSICLTERWEDGMSRHILKHPREAGARRLNVSDAHDDDSIYHHGRHVITVIVVFSHLAVSESG